MGDPAAGAGTPLVVRTAAGAVRGRREAGLTAWRGIPFAAPPVGRLRLRAPEPPERWPGVLDATRDGPLPLQPRSASLIGATRTSVQDEDCLTLTVVRRTAGTTPKPVMVFIHGGAYGVGGASATAYRGEALAAAGDVVFVGFNYRLGALGWLDCSAYGTTARPIDSNPGLRDQVAALEWVRDEIAAFGGDPGDVTLFGESAGGTSVLTLLTVPAARGLFARAAVESAALSTVQTAERSRGWADELVEALPGTGASALLDASPAELIAETVRLDVALSDRLPGARLLAPVVDGDLLPEDPLAVLRRGDGAPVPLLIGTNADEGTLFQRMRTLRATSGRLDVLFTESLPDARDALLALYPRADSPRRLARFVTDLVFWTSSVDAAAGHSGVADTWMYRFDFAPPALRALGLGAAHGSELDHVFARADGPTRRVATALGGRRAFRALTRRTSAAWISFARTGSPPAAWPRYDAEHRRTVVLDVRQRVVEDPEAAVRDAWAAWRAG